MIHTMKLPKEDKKRLEKLFKEVGDIIAKNNDSGLELDWELFTAHHFGVSTVNISPKVLTEDPQAYIM